MQTLEQLKAQAYDLMAQIQWLQANLQQVNQAIANYKPETEEEPVKEKDGDNS